MNEDIYINEKLVYSMETSDSTAIDINLFGATAVGDFAPYIIEDFFPTSQIDPTKPFAFRVIDGQLFTITPGRPNIQ